MPSQQGLAPAVTSLVTRGMASYLLGLRQPQPQLPPRLELVPVAEQEAHLAAGVAGRQRGTVAFMPARIAGCSHFQPASRRTGAAAPKAEAWARVGRDFRLWPRPRGGKAGLEGGVG